jgi:protein SCO1
MRPWHVAFWALLLVILAAPSAGADDPIPPELEGVGIVEHTGEHVPLDVTLRDQSGSPVTLGSYFDGKPVILVLAYYECPMLCTLVLNGMKTGMKELAWTAGKEYRTITVSFDPRDTPEVARQKRDNYVRAYGRDLGDRGWEFLVGTESEVRRLADSVGFHYQWDEHSKQFAHATGAFVLTPDGRVSRTLYGVTFPERDLRLSLAEASEGRLGAPWDRVQLYCFHYDPVARTYVISPVQVMKLGGVATIAALSALLITLWRREGRRSRGGFDSHTHDGAGATPSPGARPR